MMKKMCRQLGLMLSVLLVGLFAACGGSDDKEAAYLSVSPNPLTTFMSNAGATKTLQVTSSRPWTMQDLPDWLDASADNGQGDATIVLTTKSVNKSDEERTATLFFMSEGNTVSVDVRQEPGLATNCKVEPGRLVTLSSYVAFDYKCSSAVKYLYHFLVEERTVERYTDDEIISLLESKGERNTPQGSYVISVNSLSPNTNYILFMVGYNANGERGSLYKQVVTTKSSTNQPRATVEDVTYTTNNWIWKTTIGAYASKYYMYSVESTEAWNPGFVAWRIADGLENNPDGFTPIVQSSSWTRKRTGNSIIIGTWGVGSDGNFGGVISGARYYINTKAVTTQMSMPSEPAISRIKKTDLMDNVQIIH